MIRQARFAIRCDVETLRRSSGGAITANVFVELGTSVFPDRGWTDFAVVILGWWLDALRTLVDGERAVEMRFMDGPYSIRVTAGPSAFCTVECADLTKAPPCQVRASIPIQQLRSEVERVGRQLVEACHSQQWNSPDVDTLSDLLTRTASGKRLH